MIDNKIQKLTREGGGRGQCKKASLSPCRLLHPAKDLQDPLRDLSSTTRTTFLSAWGTRPYLSSSAKRKQETRASLQERPFRGSIRTQSQIGGGVLGGRGIASTGVAPQQGRDSRSHGAEVRPFPCPATQLPLRLLIV